MSTINTKNLTFTTTKPSSFFQKIGKSLWKIWWHHSITKQVNQRQSWSKRIVYEDRIKIIFKLNLKMMSVKLKFTSKNGSNGYNVLWYTYWYISILLISYAISIDFNKSIKWNTFYILKRLNNIYVEMANRFHLKRIPVSAEIGTRLLFL